MADTPDMTDKYNTKLSPEDEAKFQEWAKANPRLGNTYDYDSRGFWKAGAETADNGHGSDQWKKPNEPTFSTLSQYSGKDGYVGGTWGGTDDAPTFTPSKTNLENMSAEDLQAEFKKNQGNAKLLLPDSTAAKAAKRYAPKDQ